MSVELLIIVPQTHDPELMRLVELHSSPESRTRWTIVAIQTIMQAMAATIERKALNICGMEKEDKKINPSL